MVQIDSERYDEIRAQYARLLEEGWATDPSVEALPLLGSLVEDLHTVVEELRVAYATLRVQNEQLASAQAHLRTERERYRELFEHAPDAYLVTDSEGTIEEANPAAAELLSIRPRSLAGKRLPALALPQDREVLERLLEELRESPRAARREFWLQPRGADPLPVAVSVAAVNGAPATLHWLLRDLREQKQVEAALREREAEFRAAFDLAAAGMAQADPRTGRLLRVNRGLCEITGYPAEELLKRTFAEITHPEDRVADSAGFWRMARGEIPEYVGEKRYLRGDGSVVWVKVHASLVRDAAGEPLRTVAIILDLTAQKQAEEHEREALRERIAREEAEAARQRIETVLESITDAFYALDREWRFTYVNRHAEQFLGRGREELIGKNAWEEFPRAVATVAHEAFQRAVRENVAVSFETFSETYHRWIEAHAYPSPEGLSVFFRDISERRRAEQQEHFFRHVLEESRNEIYMFDAETLRFVRVNRGARENLGYSTEELSGLTPLDLKTEFTPETFAALLEPLRRGEREMIRFESSHRRKDGSSYPVNVHLQIDRSGERPLFVALIIDITERQQAEARARELIREHAARDAAEAAERRASFLAEVGQALAASLDQDERLQRLGALLVPELADWCVVELLEDSGKIERVVARAADPRKQALLERKLARYPHDASRESHPVGRVLRTGEAELLAEIPDEMLQEIAADAEHLEMIRQVAPASLMVVPLLARERVIGVLALAAAESGRRYREADLALAEEVARRAALAVDNARLYESERSAHARARVAIRARDDVLGIVAHDLRTPLSAIGINAHVVASDDLPERSRELLASIRTSAQQADRLIQDLLDASRIEAGGLQLVREPLHPRALLEDALRMHAPAAQRQEIRLDQKIDPELPRVHADRHRMRQVFSNLVDNAIRFTPAGGRVVLRAEAAGDEVRFSVADTGSGIPAAELPHLFDRFYQAGQRRRGGAGLGLAIVKGIVEAHGGRIWVESEVEVGSTFFFTLPTHAEAEAEAPPRDEAPAPYEDAPPPEPPRPGERIRVLVVDDHPMILRGLEGILEPRANLELVGRAASGEEAVARAGELQPDVVVMDLEMAGIGGLEAMRRITATHSGVRVLVLTSNTEEESLLSVVEGGGAASCARPERTPI